MRLSFALDSRTVVPPAKSVVLSRLGETLLRDRKTLFLAEIPLLISMQF